MAKAKVKQEVTIALELTPQEAVFLRNMLQNPMCNPSEEDPHETNMRRDLFDVLKYTDTPVYRGRTSEDVIADMVEFNK